MFKKIERNFTIFSMLALSLTMLITFFTIYYFINQDVQITIKKDLEKIGDNSYGFSKNENIFKNFKSKKGPPLNGFNIKYSKDNNKILKTNTPFYNENIEYSEMLKIAVNQNKSEGRFVFDYRNWAYIIKETDEKNTLMISIVEVSQQIKILNNLVFVFLIVYFLLLIVFFIFSKYFAKKSILPAKNAFERQKDFLEDVSHELKTPLAIIQTNTDVLMINKNKTILEQEKWINNIKNEIKHMDYLIKEITFINLTDKKIEIKKIFPLSEVLKNSIMSFEAFAYEKKVELIYDIDTIDFYGNKDDLKKIFNILIDNSIKYSSEGSDIVISLKKHKKIIEFNIENPIDDLIKVDEKLIFNRFYRVEKSRNKKTGGQGLGLFIAKSIVEKYDGKILAIKKPNLICFNIKL